MEKKRVMIIGAGFGGLFTARKLLKRKDLDITIVDKNNYHTFTPLIYQVATAALDASDVAYPVRSVFRKNSNVKFVLGEVTDIDTETKSIKIRNEDKVRTEAYDYLIVAGGSVATYFGNEKYRHYAFELNDVNSAVRIRNHVLRLFERVAWTTDPEEREAMLTMVVVGGGPTGVETAGALYELYNHVLDREYNGDDLKARVLLVEGRDHLLAPYPKGLQKSAKRQVESLGVETVLGALVEDIDAHSVTLNTGEVIPTYTVIWAAGVRANPLAEMLDVPLGRAGRVIVDDTMQVPSCDGVFIVGDMAYMEDKNGNPYPMQIAVAQQQARLAAQNVRRHMDGKALKPFRYFDKGIMATIGRTRAVAYLFNRVPMTGAPAWLAWLALHLVTLMGFRNRVAVFINWVWNYFTYDRSVRIIVEQNREPALALSDGEREALERARRAVPEGAVRAPSSNGQHEDAAVDTPEDDSEAARAIA